MNQEEFDEIERLPEKYRPLSPWVYFGYTILYSIPIVGFIILLINAFSNANINKRNFARSYFCVLIVLAVLIAIIVVIGVTTGTWYEGFDSTI